LAPELRPGLDALELARQIVDEITASRATEEASVQTAGQAAAAEAMFLAPSDFVVVTHDKYEFRIPLTGFLFNANDVWAQVSGDRARVGISDYLQQRLTDIVFVDLPLVGAAVEQFGELGSVESTKAAFDVISPVSGTVVAANAALSEEPERINQDPYGSWIAEVQLTAWDEDRSLLVDGAAYAKDVEQKAAEG
jgi:glycine cleavage system H protein